MFNIPLRNILRSGICAVVLLGLWIAGCGAPSTAPLKPTEEPTKTTVSLHYQNQHTETVFLESVDIPLENCNGSSPVSVDTSRSRTTTTTIELKVSAGLDADLYVAVKAHIALEAGVTEGEQRTFNQSVKVEVLPGKMVNYQLAWNETWQAGEVVVDNNTPPIAYRVRTGLQPKLSSGMLQTCPKVVQTEEAALKTSPATVTYTVAPMATSTPQATATATTPPTATSTLQPTATSTATIVVTLTPTSPPIPTATPRVEPSKAPAYPCPATISTEYGSRLNVVRSFPTDSSRTSIDAGRAIKILKRSEVVSGDPLYQIADAETIQLLGWIPIQYVILSDWCPK